MADKELVIRITSKNMTDADFAAARRNLAGMGDDAKKAKDEGESFGASFKGAMGIVAGAAAIAGAAVVGLAAGVLKLGARGSDIADVRAQFDILQRSAGNLAAETLPALASATGHVISNFDLMKTVNAGFSQGLRLSAADLELVGKSARVVADRVGGDTKTAFDTLVQAMATGQDRMLKQINVDIDATAAKQKLADALGVEKDALTEAQNKAASKTAVMEELNRILIESGEATDDLADKQDQLKVRFQNFVDDLSVGIADSGVFAVALDGLGDAFGGAFGGGTQGLVKAIVHALEMGALTLLEWGRTAVTVGSTSVTAFGAIGVGFSTMVADSLAKTLVFNRAVLEFAGLLAKVPGSVGMAWGAVAVGAKTVETNLLGLLGKTKEYADASKAAAIGQGPMHDALGKLDVGLQKTRDRMVDAMAATEKQTTSLRLAKPAADALGLSKEQLAAKAKKTADGMKEADAAMTKAKKTTAEFIPTLANLATTIDLVNLKPIAPKFTLPPMTGIETVIAGFGQKVSNSFSVPITQGFGNLFKNQVPQTIMSALTGGGDVLKSIGGLVGNKIGSNLVGSFGKSITGIFGQTIGGAINAFLPGIGSLIGPLVGKLVGKLGGFFKGLFGGVSKDVQDSRKAVDDFQASLASTLTATQKAEAGGEKWKMTVVAVRDAYLATGRTAEEAEAIVKKLWDTNKPAEAKAAMEQINKVLDEQKVKAGDVVKQAEALKAQHEELNKTLEKYGVQWDKLPDSVKKARSEDLFAAMHKDIETLTKAGFSWEDAIALVGSKLTDVQRQILGMADETTVDFRKMEDAAKRYGVDLAALGPQFQSAKLHDAANQIFNDFTMLTKGGADVGGVLFGMREEISALVNDSRKFGVDIPANMRPMVEELQRSGNLIDENGNKLEDLSGINFAEPITKAVDRIIVKLEEFIQVMGGKLPGVAASAAGAVSGSLGQVESGIDDIKGAIDAIPDSITIDVGFNVGELNLPDGKIDVDVGVPGSQHGGLFTRPTLRVLSEFHQPEVAGSPDAIVDALEKAFRRVGGGMSAGPGAGGDIYLAVSDGKGRRVTREEFRQIEQQIATGGIRIPARVVSQRVA